MRLVYLSIMILLFSCITITDSFALPTRDSKTGTEGRLNTDDLYPTSPVKAPTTVDEYYRLGLYYLSQNRFHEATEQFRKGLKLDPKHIYSMIGLTTVSFQLGDMETAREYSNQMIQLQPNNAGIRNTLGEIWILGFSNPEYLKEAESRFKEAISLDPKFVPAHINLARLYLSMNKKDEAINEYKTAISIQPAGASVRQELATVYLNTGSIDNALEEAKKIVELDPKNPVYLNGLGEVYMRRGQLDEALIAFQQSVKYEPKYAPGYKNIGIIYFSKKQPEKAIAEINRALSYMPDYGDAYVVLGDIYLTKGMDQNAMENYKKAIGEKSIRRVSPLNLISTYNNLAYIYSESNQSLDVALSYAQKAKQVAPNHPDIADTLGWVYYKKGNYGEAVKNLKDAADGSPNNPIIRYHLGSAYYKNKQKNEAIAELKSALNINDKFKDANEAKRLLIELGEK